MRLSGGNFVPSGPRSCGPRQAWSVLYRGAADRARQAGRRRGEGDPSRRVRLHEGRGPGGRRHQGDRMDDPAARGVHRHPHAQGQRGRVSDRLRPWGLHRRRRQRLGGRARGHDHRPPRSGPRPGQPLRGGPRLPRHHRQKRGGPTWRPSPRTPRLRYSPRTSSSRRTSRRPARRGSARSTAGSPSGGKRPPTIRPSRK